MLNTLEIGLKNNLDQNQIASKCYKLIKEKGNIKSVNKSGEVSLNGIIVEIDYNKITY